MENQKLLRILFVEFFFILSGFVLYPQLIKILDNKVDCSDRDGATIMGHLVNSARKIVKSNPYGEPNVAWGTRGVIMDAARDDINVGYITINHAGQDIIIKTCFKKPCQIPSDENILTDTF